MGPPTPSPPPSPSAAVPDGVGVDPSTRHRLRGQLRYSNTVSVIDGATNTVTATIAVGSDPSGVGVDPSTHAVYVANAASPAACR